MIPEKPEDRLSRLEALVRDCQGDVSDAVRSFCRCTTSDLGDRLGLDRRSVEQCLRQTNGRRYPHVRRAIELELDLPPGSLDVVLAGTKTKS